jgi:UDP-3-O-[3-hydroxymyristoyl] glucosamine N-acyltransferase
VKLKKLAELVSGELVGDGEIDIKGASPISEAGAGDLIFVLEEKFLAPALKSKARAIIAPAGSKTGSKPAVLVKNPRLAMAQALSHFAPKSKTAPGIHKMAVVSKSAKIGKRVTIYPFAYIGEECEIGDDSIIYPSATIYDRVKIGKRVIIHSGARIGVDGYGYVWHEGRHVKLPQVGTVVIEDDVEIYANVCIARGTLGSTRIGAGTKIDNLTHIAHNCDIGKNCAIVSLVGFAGSVTLKDHVSVAGLAAFNGHITVGENTVVLGKAGVTKDFPPNSVLSGYPAMDHSKDLELQALIRKLPALFKKIK